MTPIPHRIVSRRAETGDVTTLSLVPASGRPLGFVPGQFNMLTAYGVGEVAISVSSSPREVGPLQHTVRDVGPVTRALCRASTGDVIGVRGPFGTPWAVDAAPTSTGDTVVVAGGIGIAPLRGAIDDLVHRPDTDGGRVFIVAGARQPEQIIFAGDLEAWERAGAVVAVTVDLGSPGWLGHVGLVTSVFDAIAFEPAESSALVCGPEIMMRLTARALVGRGVDPERIRVALERNMQCGVGWCGHCQLGPFLLCRDGPVLPYAGAVSHLLSERER
ncbi:MAG: FAD/NAD(P)-binding protein [Acidimicrobiales bacterium]|nr:FAD/NAD(P)-binding protein [Acidimicrobiales bacterium]